VATYRIKQAAELLGVSDDTVRRWAESGRLTTSTQDSRQVVQGDELARLAQELARTAEHVEPGRLVQASSARNRFVGLVTRVVRDTVMAQVEIQSGPHRVVSLMSRESADELALEPGVLAIAAVKSTNVVIELPENP
jgi:molybdopterin-binding protein